MIAFEQALEIAREAIKPKRKFDMVCAIIEADTLERDGCWVFFYQSLKYLETQDWNAKAVGNAPILVRKSDGKVFPTGSGQPIEYYIKNFEETGTTEPLFPGKLADETDYDLLAAVVSECRKHLESGAGRDEILRLLRDRTNSKITSIRALTYLFPLRLLEAKETVHLSPVWADRRADDDEFHHQLENLL